MAGRKIKLNVELINEAYKLRSAGNTIKDICLFLGISESAYFEWMQKGENAKGNKSVFVEFMESQKKAEAVARIRNVAIIQKASESDWKASAWFLERRDFENWGRKDHIKADISQTISDANSSFIKETIANDTESLELAKELFRKIYSGNNLDIKPEMDSENGE